MNESGKSDKPVVPAKSAKIRFWDFYQRYVEQMEGRGLAKENQDCAGNETDMIFHVGRDITGRSSYPQSKRYNVT